VEPSVACGPREDHLATQPGPLRSRRHSAHFAACRLQWWKAGACCLIAGQACSRLPSKLTGDVNSVHALSDGPALAGSTARPGAAAGRWRVAAVTGGWRWPRELFGRPREVPVVSSDAETIRASLTDPERFGEVFDRHARALHSFLARRVGRGTADDLLSDVFRIAFERRNAFDVERADARPWLYGIASKLLLKHRSQLERRLSAVYDNYDVVHDTVEERVLASHAFAKTAAGVARLPAGEREVLLLVVWEELSYDAVADVLGIPIGTVRSRLNRARRRLRELLAHNAEELSDVPSPRQPKVSDRHGC
jgi:RNA polymerase sigma factor (sigma-70 family)